MDIGLLTAARLLKRGYDAALRPVMERFGLTRNEVDVLLFLANNPGRDTAGEIAELRGMNRSHICQSVDALTRRGWLAGWQDGRDRRRIHLTLRPEAEEAALAARTAQRDFFADVHRGVTPEERRTAERVLRKLVENVRRKGGRTDA